LLHLLIESWEESFDLNRSAHGQACIDDGQNGQTEAVAIDAEAVLDFWFNKTRPSQWFSKDPEFDALVRERFLGLTHQAFAGELAPWSETPQDGLALVLLLDQFPRQLWRESAMAFAGDAPALALSQKALDRGWVEAEPEQPRRQFWLMPLMHSEELAVQEAALPLFKRFSDPRTADFARRHRDVIARFGRFPHRNAALGRVSSAEELAFLQTPGSGF
jgi:uncharacterized protein (DUF924 family)